MPAVSRTLFGSLLLLLVTVIWGSTFAVVKGATDALHPAVLIGWRFTLGTLALLPLLALPRREAPDAGVPRRSLAVDGLTLGVWLILGYGTQTLALAQTTANRAAFFTALSVVLVPLWQAVAARKRLGAVLWVAVVLAVAGLALFSWEGGALNAGDLWALACAVSYAGFVLTLERTARAHAALPYTIAQTAVVALLAWAWALVAGAHLAPPRVVWGPLLYLGVAATSVTTLLQTVGQRRVPAAEAAVIYALEPVFAAVFSYVLLREQVGWRGLVGGALVVGATVLSQLPARHPQPVTPHPEGEEEGAV